MKHRVASVLVVMAMPLAAYLVIHASELGSWRNGGELQMVAVHAAMMPNGKVLAFGYTDHDHFSSNDGRYQLWNPATRRPDGESQIIRDWNPFCAGQCFLGDGALLVAGGFKSAWPQERGTSDKISTAHATADGGIAWRRDYGTMEDLRWYPSLITLANGDCLIIGGSAPMAADNWKDTNADYEYFSVDNKYLVRHNESQRNFPEDGPFNYPAGDRRQVVSDGKRLVGLYPLVHLLPNQPGDDAPNGLMFVLTESFVRLYNPATNRILGPKIDAGGFRTWWTQGSSVLLPIDIDAEGRGPSIVRVMVIGGGTLGKQDPAQAAVASADIYAYDIRKRALRREGSIALNRGRIMGDSHILPDGNVLVVGGAETGYTNENRNRIRKAELIRPPSIGFAGDAVDLAESTELRGYHASSVLLPDGAIFVAGGNGNWNSGPIDEFKSVEVFEAPYLSLGDRPVIRSAPAQLRPGQIFTVTTNSADVENVVVLIRNSSRTHSLDTDQRMLRLQAQRSFGKPAGVLGGIALTARLPNNPTLMPPGPYMLFLLRAAARTSSPQRLIPSRAQMLLVGGGADRPAATADRLRITIQTGSDDLRGGNDRAFAAFFDDANNPVGEEFALNGSANWANHTVNIVSHALSTPVPISRLRRLRIRTTFRGGVDGDNWNIDRLVIDYQSGSGEWQNLYDRAGVPLVRLTGDRNTWDARF